MLSARSRSVGRFCVYRAVFTTSVSKWFCFCILPPSSSPDQRPCHQYLPSRRQAALHVGGVGQKDPALLRAPPGRPGHPAASRWAHTRASTRTRASRKRRARPVARTWLHISLTQQTDLWTTHCPCGGVVFPSGQFVIPRQKVYLKSLHSFNTFLAISFNGAVKPNIARLFAWPCWQLYQRWPLLARDFTRRLEWVFQRKS